MEEDAPSSIKPLPIAWTIKYFMALSVWNLSELNVIKGMNENRLISKPSQT